MQEYIIIGELNEIIFKQINLKLITNEVIFTFERIGHVEDRRIEVFKEVKEILPSAIYNPDYIYKDWNNRNDTLVFIKNINENFKICIIVKLAKAYDEKHTKNSIITIIKIGKKTFRKILKNKNEYLLYKKLDKVE